VTSTAMSGNPARTEPTHSDGTAVTTTTVMTANNMQSNGPASRNASVPANTSAMPSATDAGTGEVSMSHEFSQHDLDNSTH